MLPSLNWPTGQSLHDVTAVLDLDALYMLLNDAPEAAGKKGGQKRI
jgi:hypothetical protein